MFSALSVAVITRLTNRNSMNVPLMKLSVTFVGIKVPTRMARTIAVRTIAMINSEQIKALIDQIRADIETRKNMPEFGANPDAALARINNINETRRSFTPDTVEKLLGVIDADKALIAEQRQAITKLEISCDRNYVEGMKTGWNYCDAGNSDGFNTCVEQREKDIRDARTAGITLDVGE